MEMNKTYDPYMERLKFLRFGKIKNNKLLDVGAGRGVSSIIAAKNFKCKVTIIDPSFKHLEEIKRLAKDKKVDKKIRFLKGDITDSKLKNDSFDYVIGYNVLHHLPKKLRKKALKEMLRISKKGLIISELNKKGIEIFDKIIHPKENHEKIKVNLPLMEYELNKVGKIVKMKKEKLINFYLVKKK